MVKRYEPLVTQIRALADQEKMTVTLPEKFDDKHQKMIDALNSASPADFDKLYLGQQIDVHKEAAELLNDCVKTADDGPVKEFAANWAAAEIKFAENVAALQAAPPPAVAPASPAASETASPVVPPATEQLEAPTTGAPSAPPPPQ